MSQASPLGTRTAGDENKHNQTLPGAVGNPMLSIVTALALGLLRSQPPSPGEIDRYLQSIVARKGRASLSVAIVRNGKIEYAKAFGYADLEKGVKATPENVYRLGSISPSRAPTSRRSASPIFGSWLRSMRQAKGPG